MKAPGTGAPAVDQEAHLYQVLGTRIKTARLQRGLSQHQLADAVGLTRSSMSNVENGKQRVLAHHLVSIGQALNLDPASFLNEEDLPQFADQLPYPIERLKAVLELTREQITGVLLALEGHDVNERV